MPILNQVTTVGSQSVWRSPDGQRNLYEVNLTYQGKPFKAKTYSGSIAQVGWTGDVITEEKQGKFGIETHIKQAPKEDYQGGYQKSYQKGGKQSNTTMFVSYAKDIVVALQQTEGFDQVKYDILLQAVIDGGRVLSQANYEAQEGTLAGEPEYVPVDNVVDPATVDLNKQLDDVSWLNDLPKS
jgi:hypothetical protein